VELDVDGGAVVDAREGGNVARLRGGRAVIADGASSERYSGDAEGRRNRRAGMTPR
jgi:hypothetical protein